MKEKTSTIRISDLLVKQLKVAAAVKGESIKEFAEKILSKAIKGVH